MTERRRTEKQLADMDADALLAHSRDLEAEADDLRSYRDVVARALGARIEAGDVPADMRPSDGAGED